MRRNRAVPAVDSAQPSSHRRIRSDHAASIGTPSVSAAKPHSKRRRLSVALMRLLAISLSLRTSSSPASIR